MQEARCSTVVISAVSWPVSDGVVNLFRRAFPKHPVSRLGASLARRFLEGFARHATFLVARDPASGSEVGFAVGGHVAALDGARSDFIRKHALAIALSAARSGSLLRLLVERARGSKPPQTDRLPVYQLRLIAVDPHFRGNGVGTRLLDAFERTLPPLAGYHLWTLANDGAEGFYTALGLERDIAVKGHVRFIARRR